MNSNLQFDFEVDKKNNTITVRREFAAKRQLVWDAYTKSEILDRWFAPKPWKAKTKSMDFRAGGSWLYAMCSPEGEEHWARMDYKSVDAINGYSLTDGFCDTEGNINPNLPQSRWDITFTDKNGHTLTETVVSYSSLNDLETVIQMGMKEGMTMTLEGLDELLEILKNEQN